VALSSTAYQRAVTMLDAVAWRGVIPGLERTRALLAALGDPHVGLRGVLVAGTNGKGSVCALLDSVCRAAGLSTVLLTKPHLISYCERIVRDGVQITEHDFGDLIASVVDAADRLPPELQPTAFETLTGAGILFAAHPRSDVLICEVGMGGRLDSTNVLDLGVAVITNVALDHTEYLGTTIAEISREKAEIIKPGNAALTAADAPARDVIRARAAEVGATLTEVPVHAGADHGLEGVEVETVFDAQPLVVRSPLVGAFQMSNVATAVAAADALRTRRYPITARAVLQGCATVRWPGRMQWIAGRPPVLVDGAHNPAAMSVFVDGARRLAGERHVVAVFAAMRNKDVAALASTLGDLTHDVVITAPKVERAATAAELAAHFAAPVRVASNVSEALTIARNRAGRDGLVVVCGSLYLAGEALSFLEDQAASTA
jgi:dihydrofolate synthase/folylpolyglutamate synthase